MEITGARVLLTGATGGIGAALCGRLVRAGAVVAVVARGHDQLERLAQHPAVSAFPADLTDPVQVASLVPRVEAELGPVGLLVNNAGVLRAAPLGEMDPDDVEQIVALNLLAPLQLMGAVVPGMLARDAGLVVNVSSFAGVGPFPGLAAYGASKAGLSQATAQLRAELVGSRVRTLLVELGPVQTEMMVGAGAHAPTDAGFARLTRAGLLPSIHPRDVANAIVTAVRRDRRHVRLPRRAALPVVLGELPRTMTRLALTGLSARG
ncbi:MAG: SDR family oxidoreductase [Mycobacteriales bacterium]